MSKTLERSEIHGGGPLILYTFSSRGICYSLSDTIIDLSESTGMTVMALERENLHFLAPKTTKALETIFQRKVER